MQLVRAKQKKKICQKKAAALELRRRIHLPSFLYLSLLSSINRQLERTGSKNMYPDFIFNFQDLVAGVGLEILMGMGMSG
jgi:hypothetical protein